MKESSLLKVLHVKPFLFLWLAEVFSQVGMNMINFALIIVAFNLTGSSTAVSGVVLSFTIPAILFGVLAGVCTDRWSKKQILLVTNLVRAVLLVLLLFWHQNLAVMYALSFLISIATQFFIPAETPMIPLLVKKELLLSANALFGMGIYGSILIAYALSGPILILLGERSTFGFLALLFLIAAFFVTFIRNAHQTRHTSSIRQLTVMEEIKNAAVLIAKTKKVLHSLFLLVMVQLLVLILAVIGPGFAKQILSISVVQFPSLFVAPAAIGMVVGAAVLSHFFHNHPKEKMVSVGIALSGGVMLFLPYFSKEASAGFISAINLLLPFGSITILHALVFAAFLLGVGNALIFVPSNTIVQEETSNEFRGKIYGFLNTMVAAVSILPVILVGHLADVFGVASVVTGIAAIILSVGVYRSVFR